MLKDENKINYSLSKIIGFGSRDNHSMSVNKLTGIIAYITGPYIIFYDTKKDKQVTFIINKNNKTFSCLSFNTSGSHIICAEGNSKNTEIQLYEIDSSDNTALRSTIKGHKYGIEKVKFLKNDKYAISIGDREDKTINIWNLATSDNIFSAKYSRPIIAFDICDSYLAFGGEQFLKIWTFGEPITGDTNNGSFLVNKYNIETGKLKDKIFSSAAIWEKKILLLTSDGHLAEMKYETKQISRWMHLKSDKGLAICVFDQTLVCGCSDGVVRVFKADTLDYVITLHRPPPLGKANIDSSSKKINISVTHDEKFADVISLVYNYNAEKLVALYSDKTFFIWDLKKSEKLYVYRFSTYHSGTINCMDIQTTADDVLRIATCSDDRTVKFWNLKLEDFPGVNINKGKSAVNPFRTSEVKSHCLL
jgi:WD40 repeat protein